MCFLDAGNYVELAKRYRRFVIESGNFVSLKEKIARNPLVGKLIGAPVVHTSILYHVQPASSYYDKKDPAKNHQLVTFDARAAEFKALAAKGVGRAYVHLDGWGSSRLRQSPPRRSSALPRSGRLGGDEALRRRLRRAGLRFRHPRPVPRLLSRRADLQSPNARSRRGRPAGVRRTWYGGMQTYLCSTLAPGYVAREPSGSCSTTASSCGAPIWTSLPSFRATNVTIPSIR